DDEGFLGQLVSHEPVTPSERCRGIQHQAGDVDVGQRRRRRVVEALSEQRAGFVDAGRVDEHDLGIRAVQNATDLGAGGLRLVRDDGDLGAEDAVEQGGLADVRAPHERGEARPHRPSAANRAACGGARLRAIDAELRSPSLAHALSSSPAGSASREMRTRPTRRPWTFSARRRWPLKSMVSPSVGTWPSRLMTKPAMVSQSPSGNSAWVSSLTSSIGMRPFTRTSPPGSGSMSGSSTSYSSTISPTSSSMRSSRVTSPAVPPYSSTTIAMW